MLNSIWADVKRELSFGNTISKIIVVNVMVFLAINAIKLILFLSFSGSVPPVYTEIVRFFSVSASGYYNLIHPWVWFTHMFVHEGFWHILWNMLFLLWFGRIVGDLIGDKRILPLYILGGLTGGLVFFVSSQMEMFGMPSSAYAMGASAAVMAITMAAGTIAPDFIIRLIFLGDVKLKYIVLVLIVIDLIGVTGSSNTGGHLAHLGGVVMGWFFIFQLRNGFDMSVPINSFFNLFKAHDKTPMPRRRTKKELVYDENRSRMKVVERNSRKKVAGEFDIDDILEKIKKQGMESLTKEELEFLKEASKE